MMAASGVVSVSRRIEASADRIFEVLSDPARHTELDGSGMLRGLSSGGSLSAVGDRFVMKMYFDRFGGDYLMDNHVVEFEPGRRVAWAPAAGDDRAGNGSTPVGVPVGHRWIFELTPDGDATVVTETYDCSAAPESLQQVVNGGEAWRGAMDETLAKLDEACAK
jgi:Polyketide cyclase / dehydrase and lipid transport